MLYFLIKKKHYIKYIPLFLIVFFISLASTIFPPTGYAMTFSFVPVICIVFWMLLIGKNFGVFQLLFVGIFTDFLCGTPLGSYLFSFSILRFIIIRVKERFNVNSFIKNILAGYCLIITFFVFKTLFFMFYYSKVVFTEYLLLNILSTLCLYPAMAVLFHWIYKRIAIDKYYVKT